MFKSVLIKIIFQLKTSKMKTIKIVILAVVFFQAMPILIGALYSWIGYSFLTGYIVGWIIIGYATLKFADR